MYWVSKDSLGAAIWAFWMSLLALVVIWLVLMGLNLSAVAVEAEAPVRVAKFVQHASAENEAVTVDEPQALKGKNHFVEAVRRSFNMGGGVMLVVFGVCSLWLWSEKRPVKLIDPKDDFIDKRARDRNVS